jgi:uncharacterized protein DUF6441
VVTPQFKVSVDQPAWLRMIREKQRPVATAAVAALKDVAAEAVKKGRDNIRSSGRFRGKWVSGLKFRLLDATKDGEPSLQAQAEIFHSMGIAGVFEFGATIKGERLLWIPTKPRAPPPSKSGRKLVFATVRGQPMLFDAADRNRYRKPLYIGVPSVRIVKRWRIIEIVKQVANQLGPMFIKHFRDF